MRDCPPDLGDPCERCRRSTAKLKNVYTHRAARQARRAREACSRHLLRDWWERAAKLAGLPSGKRLGCTHYGVSLRLT